MNDPFPDLPLSSYDSSDVDQVALNAFFSIARAWKLSRVQSILLVGEPSERTYDDWRKGEAASLPKETVERIGILLGIYKVAHILFQDPGRADSYITRANSAFGHRSALDVMLVGDVGCLKDVRRHLDSWI